MLSQWARTQHPPNIQLERAEPVPLTLLRRRTCIVILLALLALAAACRVVDESEIPGYYSASTDWGEATLLLRADHSMKQAIRTKDGRADELSGKWEVPRPGEISLKPCFSVKHDVQGERIDGCFGTVDGGGASGIEISADPDWGIAYKRQYTK
jgi:hypothetical protein